MKKTYQTPEIKEEVIEIEDVIAASSAGSFGGSQAGDVIIKFPWSK